VSISLRDSINGKCRDCIYDPLSGLGNWRQQVEACTAKACPLWPVRPVSKPDYRTRTGKTDSEAGGDAEKACIGGLDGRGATGVATP
jgi:hypothetical protein